MDYYFLLISRITVITMVITVIVGLSQRRYFTKAISAFFWYRTVELALNLFEQAFIWTSIHYFPKIAPLLTWLGITNTDFLNVFFYLNDLFFIGWFYRLLFPQKYGMWIKAITGTLALLLIIDVLFMQKGLAVGTYYANTHNIFVFVISLLYLGYLYQSTLVLPLTKNSFFWFSLALTLPILSSFILTQINNRTYYYPEFVAISLMRNGFYIIVQILMIVGFLKSKYAKYIPTDSNAKK